MPFFKDKLEAAGAWLERENERSDKVMMGRPAWWHIGKIVLGVLCIGRAVRFVLHAPGLADYALAGLFLVAGVYLVYEGADTLRQRRAPVKPS